MILLSGHSLTPARKVPLEGLSLKLTERESTAAMTPADMTGIDSNSWLRDDTEPGAGIVWRVRSIQQAYATRTPTVQLEHAISTLKDRILFGEIKPEDISGGSTCTAKQAVEYILARQSDWVLGTFGYSVSNPYKFDGDSLFDALEKVSGSLSDAWWSYDFTTYPFKLNINPRPSGVACELRSGRNLTAISRTVDRSGMYTRFYPIGKEDLHVPGDYISRNENLYGTIAHVETDQSLETVAELTAWANERLDRHAEPLVTVSADGLELSRATGESLDSLTLGRICRIPLPEFGTTIEERIVELNYPDKIHQPELVRITMANTREDVTRILAETVKQAARGGGGRAGARQQKQDHAWFEDTDEHVAMCAEGIVGVDAQGNPNWLLLSQIVVDGTGVHQHVQSVQQVSDNSAKILEAAGMELDEHGAIIYADDNVNMVGSKFNVQADKIGMVVGTRQGQQGDENYIKAGEIVLSINQSTGASEAKIDAGHVYIGNDKSTTVIAGKLNATDLTAQLIQTKLLDASVVTVNALSVTGGTNLTGTLTVGGRASFSSIAFGSGVGDTPFSDCVVDATVSGNTLTLTKAGGGTVTFSKATTLSDAWSSGTITVTASPQGETLVRTLSTGTATWDGNTATVPINAVWGSSGQYSESTGWDVTVNATPRFNAGWDYGITQRYVSAETAGSSEIPIKTLAYDEKWKVIFAVPDSSGVEQVSSYVVKAPSSGGGGTVDVVAGDWITALYPSTGRASITLSPSSGGGASQTVTVSNGYYDGDSDGYITLCANAAVGSATINPVRSFRARLMTGTWSNNKMTVSLKSNSGEGTVMCSREVDASSLVTATGLQLDAAHHTVSRVANSSTKEYTVSVSVGGWSGGNATVAAVLGTTQMQTATVSIPAASSWSASYIGIQAGDPKMSVSVNIGGASRTGTVSAAGAYNAGVTAGENKYTAGPKLKYWGNGLLFQNINGTYVPVVNANWYHDLNGTTQYYTKS